MFNRRELVQFLFLAPFVVRAATSKPTPQVLDAMWYPNTPESASYGAVHLPIAYEDNSFGGGGTAVAFWDSMSDQSMPSQARVNSVLSGLESYSGIICLDVERWNSYGNGGPSAGNAALQQYLTLLQMCRVACPEARFGYYNMAPTVYSNTYNETLSKPAVLAGIQNQNDLFAPLTAAQDVLFPTAYTVSVSAADWTPYVQLGLRECARLAPSKLVYPFLCPTYIDMPGSETVNVDPALFISEMEFCVANANGFVLWGGNSINIDLQSAWWLGLRNIINGFSPLRPLAPTGLRAKRST